MSQDILLLLVSSWKEAKFPVPSFPEFPFCTNRGWNSGGGAIARSSLIVLLEWVGGWVPLLVMRARRHSCYSASPSLFNGSLRYSYRWIFCRSRHRAGPLAIPTCVFSFCFSPLASCTIGQKSTAYWGPSIQTATAYKFNSFGNQWTFRHTMWPLSLTQYHSHTTTSDTAVAYHTGHHVRSTLLQ